MTKARYKGKEAWIADNSSRIRLTGNLRRAQTPRTADITAGVEYIEGVRVFWMVI